MTGNGIVVTVQVPGNPTFTAMIGWDMDLPLEAESYKEAVAKALGKAASLVKTMEETAA